ncbi:MAG: hypothetical protein DWQ37_02360 [Planctomycetota bacterium]|nr:MAG: hypothetical protein DWQ37_02360 [Planctomycetota bacterium]
MRRLISGLALLTITCTALGQQQQPASPGYEPAVPAPSVNAYGGGYGYGGYGGATTAAGSSMNGMANVISSKGDYNLSTSAAAVNMTQAEKQEIENRQLYTDTYFEMRETNKAARENERGPKLTAEQLARIAHEKAPKPLSPGEMDAVSGHLNWPPALQQDSYALERAQVERLFASYARLGALNYSDRTKARDLINGMNQELKDQVRDIPAPDYTESKNFLKSLMYTTCKCQLS